MRKIILWLFFKYCRDVEWELYKNNLRHLLQEQERTFVRNILTRVSTDNLQKAILNSDREHETVITIVSDAFTDQNYYIK